MKKITLGLFLLAFIQTIYSQEPVFTKQDTLRGSITKERIWWDLNHYDLSIEVFPKTKFISGKNIVKYTVLQESQIMQIDLQDPMNIVKVTQNNKELFVENIGAAHFITLNDKQVIGDKNQLTIYFEGNPRAAKNAPWDGGFTWSKDKNGEEFIATSCQGIGASLWWPCKDHMYDEAESMAINITTPNNLMDVSNGKLLETINNQNGTKTYKWYVSNPINNYGVNINIANYGHFSEIYEGENGPLSCDYYVLNYNVDKAKKHFKDAPKMLKAFEHWFGPYPFYEDGFKLVEVPYLGMEHQSSVTYGNNYKKGYLGNDLSRTGWGLKFDFIIIHESGHEWFANNITYKDAADMWIHEGFTAYSENLFLDYYYGKKASSEYVIGTRDNIMNDRPIIGKYNVNHEGSGDMYYKGANMLHTLRQLIEDDEKWRSILRGLNKDFYHQTVTTQQIEDYLSEHSGIDLTAFFNQYLRTIKVPTLHYSIDKKNLKFKWENIVTDFDMPIKVIINNKPTWIYPTNEWKTISRDSKISNFKIDQNFYIDIIEQN